MSPTKLLTQIFVFLLFSSNNFAYSTSLTLLQDLTQTIKNHSYCKNILFDKTPNIKNKKDLQSLRCNTLLNLATSLERHSSYRDIDRVLILSKLNKTLNKIASNNIEIEKIQNVVNNEISKNFNELKELKWPNENLVYFDLELDQENINVLSADYLDRKITFNTVKKYRYQSKTGKTGIALCHSTGNNCYILPDGKVLSIKDNTIYKNIFISTKFGGSFIEFPSSLGQLDLVKIAYEIKAQLFNKTAPYLSDTEINIIKPIQQSIINKIQVPTSPQQIK